MRRVAALLAGAVPFAAYPAVAASTRTVDPTRIEVMVAGRTSTLLGARLLAPRATHVRIGGQTCAVPAGTALAALLAARLPVTVTDQSGCDPASMLVTRIGSERNRGIAGWEYKVGRADPSRGAADPGGRLSGRQSLLWYWCARAGSCGRTLSLRTAFIGTSTLRVSVNGYDDAGHGVAEPGATIHYAGQTATSDPAGQASCPLRRGVHHVYAAKPGLVRSFPTTVGDVA